MSYNSSNYTRCEKCKHIDRENEKCKTTNDNWLVSDRAGTCHQFEGVESMKVRCIDNSKWEHKLELGKLYYILEVKNGCYRILFNKYRPSALFRKERFEIVEDEMKNPIQAIKEFEEQMERVGELASKCSISGEELFNNPIKPTHYQAGEFDVIAFCFKHNLDFATGNIIKYVTRAGKKDKDKTLEDLEKAKEYLERKIEWVKANV